MISCISIKYANLVYYLDFLQYIIFCCYLIWNVKIIFVRNEYKNVFSMTDRYLIKVLACCQVCIFRDTCVLVLWMCNNFTFRVVCLG